MSNNIKKYYFILVKLLCMISIIVYTVLISSEPLEKLGIKIFLLACLLMVSMVFELEVSKKTIFLILQVLFYIGLLILYGNQCLVFFPIIIMDVVICLKAPLPFYLIPFIGLIWCGEIPVYILLCITTIIIYLQNYVVVDAYKKYMNDFEIEEFQLKKTMDNRGLVYKNELEKNSIYFEKKILEEKSYLSQALHDKLGHVINGSIYQLEACKVLLTSKPEECNEIMQKVIDSLRVSMDEIRDILRREKPDKKQMAMLQLSNLCEECKEKYKIAAEVTLEGETEKVPEVIWEIILDNTFEAVSNALKYAKCNSLMIRINVLNKVVRCSIVDDGIGCDALSPGMGIQGMKQRARSINGFVDIISEGGFKINMILPFES